MEDKVCNRNMVSQTAHRIDPEVLDIVSITSVQPRISHHLGNHDTISPFLCGEFSHVRAIPPPLIR